MILNAYRVIQNSGVGSKRPRYSARRQTGLADIVEMSACADLVLCDPEPLREGTVCNRQSDNDHDAGDANITSPEVEPTGAPWLRTSSFDGFSWP
jgi:hypothetical protein